MAVVLGYDESPGSEAALDAAIQVAQRYGEELVLVYGAAPPGGMGEEARCAEKENTDVAHGNGSDCVGHPHAENYTVRKAPK